MKLLERVKTVTFIRELLPIFTNSRWGLLAITRVSISLHNPSPTTICVHRDSVNNEHSEFSEMVNGVGGSVGGSVGGIVGITVGMIGWGVGASVGSSIRKQYPVNKHDFNVNDSKKYYY